MSPVLHLRKELLDPPVERLAANFLVRSIILPDDIEGWLELRKRATADLTPPVREWTRTEFMAQMVDKPWWKDEHTWLAIDAASGRSEVVGAVTLALRTGAAANAPVVHWLLVDPAWRRRGVGKMLMSRLESSAWNAGWREIELETHAGWTDAVAFYHSMGYAPVRERSPR
jgi:GNAT superfamily N-acetyltransferase